MRKSTRTKKSRAYGIHVAGEKGGGITVSLTGRVALESITMIAAELRGLLTDKKPSSIAMDCSGITYLDSAGALALSEFDRIAHERSVDVVMVNASAATKGILGLIDRKALSVPPLIAERASANIIERIGEASVEAWNDFRAIMTFMGELLYDLIYSVFHLRNVRWNSVLFYMKKTGVDGLPIVGLISFLLGLIIAFMSSLQLKQFGANIYVASLVALAMVRELGPIMTAILVAGRSGSAFAAEIGTMIVNEEVDALSVMGFDPIRFLAIPKVIASMIVVPVLTVYAAVFGIVGGMVIGVLGLDLTVYTYVTQSMRSIDAFGVVTSLIKSSVFAMMIAGIGCQRGFQVRGGAEAVGSATTSSVVAGIFLIIVTDSAFAVILEYVK